MTVLEMALADLRRALKLARDACDSFDRCTCEDEPLGVACVHLQATHDADARVTNAATAYLRELDAEAKP